MINNLYSILVFAFVIISINFFGANFLDKGLVNLLNFGVTFLVVIGSIPLMFNQRSGGFNFPVQLMIVSISVSVLMAYSTWGQSLKDTLIATIPLLLWPFYFLLRYIRFPVSSLEKIVILFGVLYTVLYFYQYANPHQLLFGKSLWGDEFIEDRGVIRISFPGGGLFILAVFLALNRFTTDQKNKWLWGFLILAGLLVPVLQVTRVDVVGVTLIYLIHFMKWPDIPKKLVVAVICIATAFYLTTNYSSIKPIAGMVQAQKQTSKEGDKYIRYLAGDYFLTEFSPKDINRVLGNGVPYVDFSYYGKHVWALNDHYGYYLEDLGIISIYALYGIPGVLGYLLIWIRSFTISLPPEYQYAKYYLWFLLMTGLTTSNLYYPYYLISTVLALYIFQMVYEYTLQVNRITCSYQVCRPLTLAEPQI